MTLRTKTLAVVCFSLLILLGLLYMMSSLILLRSFGRLEDGIIESNTVRVQEAINGEVAVTVAKQEKPDLILMDVQLPKMDGYEATRLIKADPELAAIPALAVTSYALSGDREKALKAGCEDYVAKPFRPRELVEKVEKLLR